MEEGDAIDADGADELEDPPAASPVPTVSALTTSIRTQLLSMAGTST